MRTNDEMDLAIKYALRFGEIAVKKGYISRYQLREALEEQVLNEPFQKFRPRKLIGEILLEQGWMNQNQIEMVLQVLANSKR
jgi:hypothetical protein